MPLSIAEQLMHTTVRLETRKADGTGCTGTGFFFCFRMDENRQIPLIVSNKHVVAGSTVGTFVLTKRTAAGEPDVGQKVRIQLDGFGDSWLLHPDDNVDLAVFPVAGLLREADQQGNPVFFLPMEESLVASDELLAQLGGIEDITMIGYPNGIWDAANNLPIVRKGITATSPKFDYNGLPIFVIDCACFPGSSGSPVLLYNVGGYTDASGNTHLGGTRIALLGVLFAGPQHVAEGELTTIDVPLQHVPIALSRIPNNLGFVVKASKLLDFRAPLAARA